MCPVHAFKTTFLANLFWALKQSDWYVKSILIWVEAYLQPTLQRAIQMHARRVRRGSHTQLTIWKTSMKYKWECQSSRWRHHLRLVIMVNTLNLDYWKQTYVESKNLCVFHVNCSIPTAMELHFQCSTPCTFSYCAQFLCTYCSTVASGSSSPPVLQPSSALAGQAGD